MDGIITRLQRVHDGIKSEIEKREVEFRENNTLERIEKEFFFCLLTPQCRAKVCWANVENLFARGILQKGSEKQISENLYGIRFKNNKAHYIVNARNKFFNGSGILIKELSGKNSAKVLRKYLVENVKGMGYKEASHFLRNIGKGYELAILDRHILKGLTLTGVIEKIPGSLSAGKYLSIEASMNKFAGDIQIPMFSLDFVFWYFFNKEVFK